MCIFKPDDDTPKGRGEPPLRPMRRAGTEHPEWGRRPWPGSTAIVAALLSLRLACIFEQEHPHASNRRWYERQQRELEEEHRRWDNEDRWWFSSMGWVTLRRHGPVAWFRWTFLRLSEHQSSCRWRRLMARLGVS